MELASLGGAIDRQSPTWNGIARWSANQLLIAHIMLETAEGDRAAALRSRCKTLRDVLTIDERPEQNIEIPDFGPDPD